MSYAEHIKTDRWFAWHPVELEDGTWVWLVTVERETDEYQDYYLGLTPVVTYRRLPSCATPHSL